MTQSVRMTFAELEYLLGGAPAWESARAALGIEAPDAVGDVAAAGLASLLVRDQASLDGRNVQLSPAVHAVAGLLRMSRRWIEFLADVGGDRVAGCFGFGDDNRALVISTAALGVFEMVVLSGDAPAGAAVLAVVTALLSEPSTLLLVDRSSRVKPLGFFVERLADDVWRCRESGTDQPAQCDFDEVSQRIARFLNGATGELVA